MKNYSVLALLFFLILSSCASNKLIYYDSAKAGEAETTVKTSASNSNKSVVKLLGEAKKYLGTPYKYGGTTRKGLDCSGLVFTVFDAVNYKMPRISKEQANEGREISIKKVKEGDLVFFKTSGSRINHVGIVESVKKGEVFFIHSSTSQGVIISSMEEKYWNSRFVKATRVL